MNHRHPSRARIGGAGDLAGAILTLLAAGLILQAGCSGGDETSGTTTGGGAQAGAGGAGGQAGHGGGTAGSGGDGAGQTGGGGTGAAAGSGGTSTGGGGGSGGSGGTGGNPSGACGTVTGQHLLISEVGIQGTGAEFVEVWNPTPTTIPLNVYYLTDSSTYWQITSYSWVPLEPNSDFLVKFPNGTFIGPDEVLLVEVRGDVGAAFGTCPDFTLRTNATCNSQPITKMSLPPSGSTGVSSSVLIPQADFVMMFCWETSVVHDVDYVSWNTGSFDQLDKTGVPGYLPDTQPFQQQKAFGLSTGQSFGRCSATETGETLSGGNGVIGHDETSEHMATTFPVFSLPNPGLKNLCIP